MLMVNGVGAGASDRAIPSQPCRHSCQTDGTARRASQRGAAVPTSRERPQAARCVTRPRSGPSRRARCAARPGVWQERPREITRCPGLPPCSQELAGSVGSHQGSGFHTGSERSPGGLHDLWRSWGDGSPLLLRGWIVCHSAACTRSCLCDARPTWSAVRAGWHSRPARVCPSSEVDWR